MAKKDEVVLVSPKGNEHVITNPATRHNLLARGYKPKRQSVGKAERKITPATDAPRPEPTVATDAKPVSGTPASK